MIPSRTTAKDVAEPRSNPIYPVPSLVALARCLHLRSAIPTWLMSFSQKDFGSSLWIRPHGTLKTPFSPTVSVCFLFAYQKGWSQIVPPSFGRLGPDGEEQLYSSPRTFSFSEGDSNTYPNGAAWEWRARPESSSLGKSPSSRHSSSNPQIPGTLPDACGTSLVKSPPPSTSAGPPSTDESNGPSSPIPRTPPSGLLTQALASFCKPGPGPAPMSPRKQHPRALTDSPEHAESRVTTASLPSLWSPASGADPSPPPS